MVLDIIFRRLPLPYFGQVSTKIATWLTSLDKQVTNMMSSNFAALRKSFAECEINRKVVSCC